MKTIQKYIPYLTTLGVSSWFLISIAIANFIDNYINIAITLFPATLISIYLSFKKSTALSILLYYLLMLTSLLSNNFILFILFAINSAIELFSYLQEYSRK